MNRPEPPCLDCEHRELYCHGTCPMYIKFQTEMNKYKEYVISQKNVVEAEYVNERYDKWLRRETRRK